MVLRRLLVENREQECTVVKRAVLDSVIQLRDAGRVEFFGFDVAEVFKEFFPAFPKEPRFVATAPEEERRQRSDCGQRVEKRGRGSRRKQICDGSRCVAEVYDRSRTYHRSWILSTSNNSKFFRIVARKELNSSMTSCSIVSKKAALPAVDEGTNAHPDNLYGLFLHTLRPRQLRPLLRLSRPQKNLQPFLDIIHQVLCSIRIVE